MKRQRTVNMILCAMFTALIAVGAFIRIPVPYIPFTLQTFFVLLSGLVLGGKWGGISAGLYMVLGLIGLPVFTEGGGFWYILKPSFGYILGFCFGTFITGRIAETFDNPTIKHMIIAGLSGIFAIYIIGMGYAYLISNLYLGINLSIKTLFTFYFILLIPGDFILCILAAYLSGRLRPLVQNERKNR